MIEGLSSKEIINGLSGSWEDNSLDTFVHIFHKDALIYHPYFQQPINPLEAMEVMNTAVSGKTIVENYQILKGNGNGIDDLIQLEIVDTGSQIDNVCYVGIMPMEIYILNHKIKSIAIKKGKFKKVSDKKKHFTRTYPKMPSLNISIQLAKYWGSNAVSEYLDLFSDKAQIKHILFNDPAPPEIVVDIMNCNVMGTTKLYDYKLIKGNGYGEDDVIRLKFLETGNLVGYTPEKQGVMNVEVIIKNFKIEYLEVLGYEIIEIKNNMEGKYK